MVTKSRTPDRAALRQIPSVDELLTRPKIEALIAMAGRALVTSIIRKQIAQLRAALSQGLESARPAALEDEIQAAVALALTPSLRHVINASGVVLHTNLGRAPLSEAAIQHIAATAGHYINLEYDIATGKRGKRDVHTANLLAEIVGAQAAIVVNNNAAAIFLVLNTFAKNAEVIVSRGELIEIGDGFRIPDILAESGAVLREVGTTNRTRIGDYAHAVNKNTRLLLRVHPSNFRITGFTARPTLEELVALGKKRKIPVCEDLGSGCLADLAPSGVNEPVARESFIAGAGIITFSGDKLLGGPQAGIIAGKKELIERVRRNPLFRALRVDKLTIAALEATVRAYQRGALDDIPTLRMIRTPAAEIAQRAQLFVERLRPALSADATAEIIKGNSVIGGGSTPDQSLPTFLVAITSRRHNTTAIEARLREPKSGPPVIARVERNRLILDLRTVQPNEEFELASAISAALYQSS
ncbi:MAG: L-seryl-tRNA(Sec) selenium transferase [Candidatus Acidiferrales bacterium]